MKIKKKLRGLTKREYAELHYKICKEHNLVDKLRDCCESYTFNVWNTEAVQNSLQHIIRHNV